MTALRRLEAAHRRAGRTASTWCCARWRLAAPGAAAAGEPPTASTRPLWSTPVAVSASVVAAAKTCAGEPLPERIPLDYPLVTRAEVDQYLNTTYG